MYRFEKTCQIQVDALAGGQELVRVDPGILAKVGAAFSRTVTEGQGSGLVWPALLRKLQPTDAE